MKPLRPTTIFVVLLSFLFTTSCKKEQSAAPVNAPTTGPGPNAPVYSTTIYNGNLVIYGAFSEIHTLPIQAIGEWNGSNWSGFPAAGSPTTVGGPLAVGVYNNELLAYQNWAIYESNGNTWQNLGGPFSRFYGGFVATNTMQTYNGNLVVAGTFDSINKVPLNNIAQWNGSTWSSFGRGMTDYGYGSYLQVNALTIWNGNLVAAGAFDSAGGIYVGNIAQWNGNSWSALGSGIAGTVTSLAVFNGNLIAAGSFTLPGGAHTNNVVMWNGYTWAPLGTEVEVYVTSLAVFNNNLIAGGYSASHDGTCMLQWDGTNWTNPFGGFNNPMLGSGYLGSVNTLCIYNGSLVVGGSFEQVNGVDAFNLAQWNGSTWSSL